MLALERHWIPPRFAINGHGHAQPHLVIVSGGDLEQEMSGRVYALRKGSARLSRAHAQHRLAFGGNGADCVMMEAGGVFWSRIFTRALGKGDNAFTDIALKQVLSLGASGSAEHLAASPGRLLAFGEILASFRHPERVPPAWLDEALNLLDRGAAHSLFALAEQLRRHRTHFTRSFAAHVGFLPSEYRALRRAASAAAAVREGDVRLCDVALEHGFAHQSHMTNAFRELFGVPPSQLRGA